MRQLRALAVSSWAAVLVITCAASTALATKSLIVQFSAGNPYAFQTFEFTGEKTAALSSVTALNVTYNMQYFRSLWRASNAPSQNIYRLDFPDTADIVTIRAAYAECPDVTFASIDPLIQPLSTPVSNVPSDFWWHHTFADNNFHSCSVVSGDSLGWRLWHLKAAMVDRAWTITTGDSSVVVAIIDSSFDTSNPELQPLLYRNEEERGGTPLVEDDNAGYPDDFCGYDFADHDNNVMPDPHWWQRWECEKPNVSPCGRCWNVDPKTLTAADYQYCFGGGAEDWACDGFGAQRHGMQMASIISSAANDNGSHRGDVVGYSWQAKILPIKIGAMIPEAVPDPIDWDTPTKLSAAIEGLQYVHAMKTQNGVNIRALNMSMQADNGGNFAWVDTSNLRVMYNLIAAIRSAGIVPIGGAGNSSNSIPVLPCRVPGCFCTAAVYPDSGRTKSWNSNYGEGGDDPVSGRPYEGVDICGYSYEPQVDHYGLGVMTPAFEPWENPYWGFCTTDTGVVFQDTTSMHVDGVTPLYTSGTTAQATGMVALLVGLYPSLSPDQIEAMIKRGADPVDAENIYGKALGAGAINAYKTLTLWGEVSRDTTLAGRVYVSGSVVVPSGVTMTIDAGTELMIAPDDIMAVGDPSEPLGIYVSGTLVVNGSSDAPVRMHSWATRDTTGNWEGIYVGPSGAANLSHLRVKHATYGIWSGSSEVALRECRFDSCTVGVMLANSGLDTSSCYGVTAAHCTKGFHISGAVAELDSCRADSNQYGFYFDNNATVYIHNDATAYRNTLHGIYCNVITDIGPDVWTTHNGQNGLYVVKNQQGTRILVDGLVSEYNQGGAGIRVDYTQRVEVANSAVRANYDNVQSKYNSRIVLGDATLARGRYNSITDPVRYHVANMVPGVTLMAEDCYWGYCDDETMPVVNNYGIIDMVPMLCDDPQSNKRMPESVVVRPNWVSRNYPNPFNPCTRIDYQVAITGSRVVVTIYDVAGRRVRSLVNEPEGRGAHSLSWNGRDDVGRVMGAGVYFYSVRIGQDFVTTGKMSLIK